jgi:pimeloyl-ACP methyl ester carboxylesterase
VEAFAKDIISIVKKEKLKNIILIGHSMGGEVVLEVNARIPESIISILGIDTYKDVDFKITEEFKKSFKPWINNFYNHYPEEVEKFARENLFKKNDNST